MLSTVVYYRRICCMSCRTSPWALGGGTHVPAGKQGVSACLIINCISNCIISTTHNASPKVHLCATRWLAGALVGAAYLLNRSACQTACHCRTYQMGGVVFTCRHTAGLMPGLTETLLMATTQVPAQSACRQQIRILLLVSQL